jgi:hypothetical protein
MSEYLDDSLDIVKALEDRDHEHGYLSQFKCLAKWANDHIHDKQV